MSGCATSRWHRQERKGLRRSVMKKRPGVYPRWQLLHFRGSNGRHRSLPRVGRRRPWQTSGPSNCTDDGRVSAPSGWTIAIQRNPRSSNPREPASRGPPCLATRPSATRSFGRLIRSPCRDEHSQLHSPFQTGAWKDSRATCRGFAPWKQPVASWNQPHRARMRSLMRAG
jgi:hypothetical protein